MTKDVLNQPTQEDLNVPYQKLSSRQEIQFFEKGNVLVDRDQYEQIQLVITLRLTISALSVVSGMTYFEFYDPFDDEVYLQMNLLNVLISIFAGLSVGLFLLEIHLQGKLLKWQGLLSEYINPFAYYGTFSIVITSILLIIHPLYDPGTTWLNTKESYWNGEEREYYGRKLNDYFLIVQITVHFINAIYQFLKTSHFGCPRVKRLANLAGVQHDVMFNVKSILQEDPQSFSVILMIILIIYFSIIIRIIETGIQRSFNYKDFTTEANFDENWIGYGIFDNYKNCIWNMFITMSTIGYGDINVQSTFSRIILLFISLSGLSVTSILIVAYSNFFELEKLQQSTFTFFNALELKLEMRKKVSLALWYWKKMLHSAKVEHYQNYKTNRATFTYHLDQYRLMKNVYYANFGNNDIDVLGIQLINIDNILDYYIRIAFVNHEEIRHCYANMTEGKQNYIKFVEEELIQEKIKNFEGNQ